jgi:hypothetical protein
MQINASVILAALMLSGSATACLNGYKIEGDTCISDNRNKKVCSKSGKIVSLERRWRLNVDW